MKFSNLITLAIFLLLWLAIGEAKLVKPILLPPLPFVFSALQESVFSTQGIADILSTLQRVMLGFLAGVSIAVPLGILIGLYRKFYDSIEWAINFFRSVPVPAMYPLFMIFLGFQDLSKIAMGAWTGGFVVLVNTIEGVWSASRKRRIMAVTKHATKMQLLTKITLFEAMPFIFAGIRIGFAWNLIAVITAEMFLGTNSGIGHMIYYASVMFDTPRVIAGIILIGIIGYAINRIVLFIEEKVIHWKGYS